MDATTTPRLRPPRRPRAPMAAPVSKPQSAPKPSWLQRSETAGHVELSWKAPRRLVVRNATFGVLTAAVGLTPMRLMGLETVRDSQGLVWLTGGLLAGAAAMFVSGVTAAARRRRIRMDRSGLTFGGPTFLGLGFGGLAGRRNLARGDLAGIAIAGVFRPVRTEHASPQGEAVLHAVTRGGRRQRMCSVRSLDAARYIEQTVEGFFGLVDDPGQDRLRLAPRGASRHHHRPRGQ